MKKLALLLIPALLALSACKPAPTPSPVDPSSGGEPSSEQPSSESSSSEEPWVAPTIEELLDAISNDSYELLAFQSDFEGQDEVDSMCGNVRKEGTSRDFNIEYQTPVDLHHTPLEFKTDYFINCHNDYYSIYTLENDFWVSSHIFVKSRSDDNPVALDIIDSVYEVIADIEEGEQYDWTYDEETATYHGESNNDITVVANLVLCPGFFSSLDVTVDIGDDMLTVTKISASHHNDTHVELPATPINDIYSAILNSYFIYRDCTSFTLVRDVHIQDEHQDISQRTLFKMTHDYSVDQVDVKVVINDEDTYYYRQTYDDNYYFEYRRPDSDWMPISQEEFEEAIGAIYVLFYFFGIVDQIALANAVEEIIECNPGSMSFRTISSEMDTLPGTQLKESTTYSFGYDVDTYAFESLIIEREGRRESYTYSDINNTVID